MPTGRATRRAAHRDDARDDDDDDARAMEMTGTRAHIAQRLVSARPTRRATTPMTNGTRMQRLSRPRAAFARVVATLAIGDVAADVGGSSMSRAVAAREVMARARGGDALRVTLARAGEDGTGCYLECASDARVLDDGSVFVRGVRARGVRGVGV